MDAFPILGEMLEESIRSEKDHFWKEVSENVWVDKRTLARIRQLRKYSPMTLAEVPAPSKSTSVLSQQLSH